MTQKDSSLRNRERPLTIARRDFLTTGITTVTIGTLAASLGLKEILTQAKQVDKPLLTERNFNNLIPRETDAFRKLAKEAKKDLRAFIQNHFYLTASQKRKLEALTDEEIQFVNTEIDKALKGRYRVRVEFRRRTASARMRFVSVQQTIDPNAPKPCGSGTNENCKGNLCACRSMVGNDVGGVIGYGDDCDIAGG